MMDILAALSVLTQTSNAALNVEQVVIYAALSKKLDNLTLEFEVIQFS